MRVNYSKVNIYMYINRYIYMQINTLRAQVIHKEKHQPHKNVCLILNQTCETITKEAASKFTTTWHQAVLIPHAPVTLHTS